MASIRQPDMPNFITSDIRDTRIDKHIITHSTLMRAVMINEVTRPKKFDVSDTKIN